MKATRVLGKMTSYEEIYYVGKINCIEAQSQAQTSWLPPHIFLSNFFLNCLQVCRIFDDSFFCTQSIQEGSIFTVI